mmetsp:Transcript_51176/g.59791  ORF Transcript_51176/g.59791 Transcript_51176/m.59791 type:complete len:311 (-) Transcript_51176:118-1050(-)
MSLTVGGALAVTGAVNELTDGDVTPLELNIVRACSLFAVGISIAAIVEVDHILVDTASAITILFSLFLSYQKYQLKYFGTIKSSSSKLELEAQELKEANDNLAETMKNLDSAVKKSKKLEKELKTIAKTSDVTSLVRLTKEQKRIAQEIKKNLQAKVLQDVLGIVLQSDRNNDMKLGAKEVQILCFRIGQIEGVDVNEDKLRQQVQDQPISKVMDVLRDVVLNEDDDDHGFFQAFSAQKIAQYIHYDLIVRKASSSKKCENGSCNIFTGRALIESSSYQSLLYVLINIMAIFMVYHSGCRGKNVTDRPFS